MRRIVSSTEQKIQVFKTVSGVHHSDPPPPLLPQELTCDRDALSARLDSVTADTVSLLQTTAPGEASTFDLRPPQAYHRLNEAVTELQTMLGTGEEVRRGAGGGGCVERGGGVIV